MKGSSNEDMEVNVITQPDYESIRMESDQFMEDRNELVKNLYLF
jgi:hypothetical protein